MSKTKPQKICKICSLIHTHKALWVKVHEKILKENAKKVHVCKWLNSQGDLINANRKPEDPEFPKFNTSNFTRHFQKHVPTVKKMKAELRAAMLEAPRASEGFTSDELGEMDGVIDAEQDALSGSFQSYPEIVQKLETIIMQDLVSEGGLLGANGKLRDSAADSKLKLLNSLITIKRSLADVQRTEQVGGSAVRHSMVRLGQEVISGVSRVASELRETLKQQFPDSSLPDEVEKLLTTKVVEIIKSAYPEILEDVFKLYGIK